MSSPEQIRPAIEYAVEMTSTEFGRSLFAPAPKPQTTSNLPAEELRFRYSGPLESSRTHIPLALTGVVHLLYFLPHLLQIAMPRRFNESQSLNTSNAL
jgi:hypothetical protein